MVNRERETVASRPRRHRKMVVREGRVSHLQLILHRLLWMGAMGDLEMEVLFPPSHHQRMGGREVRPRRRKLRKVREDRVARWLRPLRRLRKRGGMANP